MLRPISKAEKGYAQGEMVIAPTMTVTLKPNNLITEPAEEI
jgi:hypothetical protein